MARKKSAFLKTIRVTLGVIVGLILDLLFVNRAFSYSLRRYIRSFEPVRYDRERIIPEYDEELGYPESGITPGTKWEDLPEDFECPLCAVSKEEFSAE